MRIAFITTSDGIEPKDDLDRPIITDALVQRGIQLDQLPWGGDPKVLLEYDLVAFRSPWDYHVHEDRFVAWLDAIPPQAKVHNPPALIRWNMDKTYLADLAGHGVAIVPTSFARSSDDIASAISAAQRWDGFSGSIVIKPTVSAGSRDTGLFRVDDPAAVALADRIVAAGSVAMVQPAIPSVATDGELALIYLGGSLSHAVRKGPILELGGSLLGGEYQEAVSPEAATGAEIAVAESVRGAVRVIAAERGWDLDDDLLYARYDVVMAPDGEPLLLEAELFEPSLFFGVNPECADRFAHDIETLAER